MPTPMPPLALRAKRLSNGLDANWQQVRDFHLLCGFPAGSIPSALPTNRTAVWSSWIGEELTEFSASRTIEDQADAVIDLIYLGLGALVEMGIPPQAIFDLVHNSNLAKVSSGGFIKCDDSGKVIKPADWQSPQPSIKSYIEGLHGTPSDKQAVESCAHTKLVLLLSGAIASGKSEVSKELTTHHAFKSVGTGKFLMERCREMGVNPTRATLQDLGDDLDIQTDYQWPVNAAYRSIAGNPDTDRWLLDSVRKRRQVENFRARPDVSVIHVHLTASELTLKSRYENRVASLLTGEDIAPYKAAIDHPNEQASRALGDIADLVCDTESLSPSEIAAQILNLIAEKEAPCDK